jgi:hypothetical protein
MEDNRAMQRLACILVTLAVLALVLCMPSVAEQRRPARPGSFVRYSVHSVDDLVRQVTQNPTVAKRYSRHFGVSPEKLAGYFKENLKVITLSAPVKVRTYFISKNGRILSKLRVLPAGRQVYATLGGKILIETDCGNPISKKLPVETKVLGTTETVPPLPVEEEVVVPPPLAAGPEVVEAVEDATMRNVATAVEPVMAASAPSFLQVAEAVVPALAGLHYVQTRKSTPEIPEPSSILSLAMACSGLAGAHVVRRRSGRKSR